MAKTVIDRGGRTGLRKRTKKRKGRRVRDYGWRIGLRKYRR